MRWHKFISAILHPVVMPTIGILVYFILSPVKIAKQQQYALLGIIFISTYIIPLLLLIFLKGVGLIKSYQVTTIEERKVPLFFMISLFFILGKVFFSNSISIDISYLFFGTVLSLIIVYVLFFTKTKTSLHLLSMGNAVGFFLILQQTYNISILAIVATFILLSGVLASSRLHLKAHTIKEVFLGFFIGLASQFLVYYFLG